MKVKGKGLEAKECIFLLIPKALPLEVNKFRYARCVPHSLAPRDEGWMHFSVRGIGEINGIHVDRP
jgi:hypothetical protein